MKTAAAAVGLAMLGGVAHADTSLLDAQTRIARDAAKHGSCDVVAALGSQVSSLDATYYSSTFAVDPDIAGCSVSSTRTPVHAEVRVASFEPTDLPRQTGARIFGQIFVGSLASGLGGLVTAGITYEAMTGCHPPDIERYDGPPCWLIPTFFGAFVGIGVGATTGVFVMGRDREQTASIPVTLVGAAVGEASALGLFEYGPRVGFTALVVLPAVGATMGFLVTRRVRVQPVVTPTVVGLAGRF